MIHKLCLSDHDTAQTLTVPLNRRKTFVSWFEYKRNYCVDNVKKFYSSLAALSFSEVLCSADLSASFDIFYELVCMFYELCFPLIKVKFSNKKSKVNWFSRGLRISCKVKRQLFMKTRIHDHNIDSHHGAHYKQYSKLLKKCINKSQRINNCRYIKTSINKCKATWNVISSAINNNVDKNSNDICSLNYNNETFNNPIDICNIFNNHFIDITNKSITNEIKIENKLINKNPRSIFLRPIDEMETIKIIRSLHNSQSCGLDGITTNLLKLVAPFLSVPLTHIINLSFCQGLFPERLKVSIVKPLFKRGDRSDPNNYRPITIVSTFSKVIEKAMCVRLNEFLNKHDILHSEQYGFRKGFSTELACFNFVKYITETINAKIPVASLFLDMSRAFDFVQHSILLDKLESYGIRGVALGWFRSYLADRRQCTEINRFNSKNTQPLRQVFRSGQRVNAFGVPQGSNLGPLLFLLYVNDLPLATSSRCLLYADDTTVIVRSSNRSELTPDINNTLVDIINWMDRNNLNINLSKTQIIQFQSYNTNALQLRVNYGGSLVEETNSVKFLGLHIDKHLNWKHHIDYICNRLNRFVYALRRLRKTVSVEAANTAYHGHVSSVLSYGLILWGNSVEVGRVFVLQKKCVRAISNAWYTDSCRPLFKKLNVLPLPCLYIRNICVFTEVNSRYFKKHTEVSIRQQRQQYRSLLHQPKCNTDIYKRNTYNMCIKLFNNLPHEIKLLHGLEFKTKLTEWLLNHCFYSVKEFTDKKFV